MRLPRTIAEIDGYKTPDGFWLKARLESWGVEWPPKPGWKERLVDKAAQEGVEAGSEFRDDQAKRS